MIADEIEVKRQPTGRWTDEEIWRLYIEAGVEVGWWTPSEWGEDGAKMGPQQKRIAFARALFRRMSGYSQS